MTLIAKPVIEKQFWILQENNRKVGNIEACAGGYQVKINNQVAQFKTIKLVEQRVNITFESAGTVTAPKSAVAHVHGYSVTGRMYNPVWDVSQQLPVFTKTVKSKSWFAAGWYNVKKGRNWRTVQSPKLIVLQRYPYQGPFYTQDESTDHVTTFN
jgi:1,4-dihydroxy-2-naphthoyl-CoA synthase